MGTSGSTGSEWPGAWVLAGRDTWRWHVVVRAAPSTGTSGLRGVRLVNGGACGDAGMGGTGADAQPKCVCVCDGSDGALMWRVNGCVPEWAGAGAAQQVACQSGGGLALGCLLAGLVAARPGASTVAGPCLAVCLSVPQPQNPPTPSL